jgi:chromosome segregation ATPase
MKRFFTPLLLTLALPALAQDISPAEQRLRDTLRNTMLQLRTEQTERSNLQADKIQNEARIQQLEAEVERLNKKVIAINKEAAAEQDIAKKKLDTLQAKTDSQEQQIEQLKQALEKWKAGYGDAVKIAKERESLRAKAVSKAVVAERKLAERERQNLELYETGSEILERLQNFGLGTALTAREPFVGVTRVKLQNLVQDYGDRLEDSKYNPFQKQPAESPTPVASATEKTAEDERKTAAEVQKPKGL